MGEYMDKAKGTANEAIGKVKVAAGKHVDKPELIAEGAAQQIKGQAQIVAGKLKGVMDDKS